MTSTALLALRRALVRTLLPLVTVLATCAVPSAARAGGSPATDAREEAVIERLNAVRADHGLGPLALDLPLSRAADRHSRRMLHARTLAHRLGGEGSLQGRLRWAIGGARAGEVILWGSGSMRSSRMVRAWMDSPGHRALLLSRTFSRAGIGVRSGREGLYATIDLASA